MSKSDTNRVCQLLKSKQSEVSIGHFSTLTQQPRLVQRTSKGFEIWRYSVYCGRREKCWYCWFILQSGSCNLTYQLTYNTTPNRQTWKNEVQKIPTEQSQMEQGTPQVKPGQDEDSLIPVLRSYCGYKKYVYAANRLLRQTQTRQTSSPTCRRTTRDSTGRAEKMWATWKASTESKKRITN